jgi:Ca-activated chloride channel homolog
MRARLGTSVLVVWCCIIALTASGQPRGRLAGTVVDAGGLPLPGATVTVTGVETRSATTNERGEFVFTDLPPGSYHLEASLAGFTVFATSVHVTAGAETRAAATLQVAALQETVTVSGQAPPIKAASSAIRSGWMRGSRERYALTEEQPFQRAWSEALSTLSVDVDTASYANTRRFLSEGQLPPPEAVRTEELVNYFRFDYAPPGRDEAFRVTTEVAPCPWARGHLLALIGIQAREIPDSELPPRNLVYLIDVSGSMDEPDKLPLVQSSLRMLTNTLRSQDRVAIVVYAGASGLVLAPTSGAERARIHGAIDRLHAGGSTNGGEGLELAYAIAREHFDPTAANRVILATDGDFNVGVTGDGALKRLIERQRDAGIYLSVLGVGTGNLQDATMELLAQHGNGNYAYLDSVQEARRVLIKHAGGTLVTIAKDVKMQVEFNPRTVEAYRLIGYDNRVITNEDFDDERKDAGDVGAGHSVTVLFELVPVAGSSQSLERLKYQQAARLTPAATDEELATVRMRYKHADGGRSRELTAIVPNQPQRAGRNLGFASAVAEIGLLLRGSRYAGDASFMDAIGRARRFQGRDPDGYRAEFVRLAEAAGRLKGMDVPIEREHALRR